MPPPSTSFRLPPNTCLMTWVNNVLSSLISLLSPILPMKVIAISAAEDEPNNHQLAGCEPLYVMHQSSVVDQRGQTNLVVIARSRSESFSS